MPLYRPPAEAYNAIIQVTLGCSYNKCSFCTMYENKNYKQRNVKDVFRDIEKMAKLYPQVKRVFLADGDALNLPTKDLIKILQHIKLYFNNIQRISSYASPYNMLEKTQDELNVISDNGLNLIYYGIESGNWELLKLINKPMKPSKIIEGLNKATKANIKISATVILGLGGKSLSNEHIRDTAKIINECDHINYLSTLQLMLKDNTEKEFFRRFKKKHKKFIELTNIQMLNEQVNFISLINPKKTIIFRSNHASNSLPLRGNLPKDKTNLLNTLKMVLA